MGIELKHNFQIEMEFDEVFEQEIKQDTSGPIMSFKIRPTCSIWPNGENSEFVHEAIMTSTLKEMLVSIEGIYRGDSKIIEFSAHGPMYLSIEERDIDSVWVTRCFDKETARYPEKRSKYEIEVPITKDAVAEGIIEAANEFYEKVIEINPDMAEDEYIQELKEKIEEAEEIYEKRNSK